MEMIKKKRELHWRSREWMNEKSDIHANLGTFWKQNNNLGIITNTKTINLKEKEED